MDGRVPDDNKPRPQEFDTPVPDKECSLGLRLFTLLFHFRNGWFADHAPEIGTTVELVRSRELRTAAGRCGCNRRAACSSEK